MAGGNTKMEKLPDGWLHEDAIKFLNKLVLLTVMIAGDFLEIGSWHGRSSVVIGRRAKELNGKLYCIDTWNTKSWDTIAQCLPEDREKFIWEKEDGNPLEEFTANIKVAGLEEVIVPLVGTSESFKETWDKPLRFIFIDGCHYYDFVKKDAMWREFLTVGGIIVFHDYTNIKWDDVRRAVDDEMDSDNCFEEIGQGQSLKAFRCVNKV